MEKVKYRQLSILLINMAHSTEYVCQQRQILAENDAVKTLHRQCFDCLAYSSSRIVLPGQLPGDLNMLQHIKMDPQATAFMWNPHQLI